MTKITAVDLIDAISQKVSSVRTKSLDLSFNELADMHNSGELIITPDYQRTFRWSIANQSRFIESLLLEMPIPPIFAIETDEGVYELIDGLQRISSYLHFRGLLTTILDEEGEPCTSGSAYLILDDCDITPELNGHTYNDLPVPLQIRLKRNFIRVNILRKESDHRLRYHMFKRLNTGGAKLSAQEIRNCVIRLLDNSFNSFLIHLSENTNFKDCIDNLSERQYKEKEDQSLILRFFAFKNNRNNYKHDVEDFLTDYMEAVSDPDNNEYNFDYTIEKEIFEKTFAIFKETMGATIFSAYNMNTMRPRGGFSRYHYEAFTLGIQPFINQIDLANERHLASLKDAFESIKKNNNFFILTTGGGKNYSGPLNKRIDFVSDILRGISWN